MELRTLTPDDWRVWREVRIRALAEAPYAFAGDSPTPDVARCHLSPGGGVVEPSVAASASSRKRDRSTERSPSQPVLSRQITRRVSDPHADFVRLIALSRTPPMGRATWQWVGVGSAAEVAPCWRRVGEFLIATSQM